MPIFHNMALDICNLLQKDVRDIPFLTDLVHAEFYSNGLLLYPEKDLLALKEHIYSARDYYDSQAGKLDKWTDVYERYSLYATRCCLIAINIAKAIKDAKEFEVVQTLYLSVERQELYKDII